MDASMFSQTIECIVNLRWENPEFPEYLEIFGIGLYPIVVFGNPNN
jgi:hypothetical protein